MTSHKFLCRGKYLNENSLGEGQLSRSIYQGGYCQGGNCPRAIGIGGNYPEGLIVWEPTDMWSNYLGDDCSTGYYLEVLARGGELPNEELSFCAEMQ